MKSSEPMKEGCLVKIVGFVQFMGTNAVFGINSDLALINHRF
jgi:hypothetical protein